MVSTEVQFTVMFNSTYWIGVLELICDGNVHAARHLFGSEPSPQEIYEFVLAYYVEMSASATASVEAETTSKKRVNFKRMQREVKHAAKAAPINTQAQEALRLQHEQNEQERKKSQRDKRDALRDYKRKVAKEKTQKRRRGH